MRNNLLEEISTEDILNGLGIAWICKARRGFINKYKGMEDYYEVISVDIGFKIDSDIFISLKDDVGKSFLIGHDDEEDKFAMGFKEFSLLCEENKGYNPDNFLNDYKAELGKFYRYDAKKDSFEEITDSLFLKRNKKEKINDDLNILKMFKDVKKTIIAQDEQIKQILASVYKNQKIINSSLDDDTIRKLKENIIIYGPTGTGKTEILSQIAKICNVPIVIEDVTTFTETGYVGRDVSEMLSDLYSLAGMDLQQAEKGILVIDEFDKLADGGIDALSAEGPSRNGVQRSLLKLLDGGTVSFREDNYDGTLIDFNTSKLTIVALGAFTGIKKNDDYSDISIKDLEQMGIMREVLGRFSKLVPMNSFSRDDYRNILLESNLSPLNTYQKLFDELGIKFSYDDKLIDYIIDEAIALDCGARSLKTVFDGIISDGLFDVFAENKENIHLTVPQDEKKSYVYKKKISDNKGRVGFY